MPNLFVGSRELDFISDITKEIVKDVIGQRIYYYAISEHKTLTHGVYNESLQKVFDNPIIIDCLVDSNFQTDTTIDKFGTDKQFKLEVFIQYRDLVEKGINLAIGDFFSFSDVFYEISEHTIMRNIYGMPDHKDGVKIIGTRVRESQFKTLTFGPTDIARSDADAVRQRFVQQRGEEFNKEGATADQRALIKSGVLDPALTGPREVSPAGGGEHGGSSFYDE